MLITLLTDFGTSDTYVGQMKGVIGGIAPDAAVVDLSHAVPAQDVVVAAVMLDDAADAFPEGAIHVVVVDPGVGSARKAVAVRTKRCTLVGPDNGVFALLLRRDPALAAVELANDAFHHHPVSHTFHGRDIFAPAAAHLAAGVKLEDLGPAVTLAGVLNVPTPQVKDQCLHGQVLLIDHFGNLVTSITRGDVVRWRPGDGGELVEGAVGVVVGNRHKVHHVGRTFADAPSAGLIAYLGSTGRLEIAQRDGSAARRMGVRRGAAVVLGPAACAPL